MNLEVVDDDVVRVVRWLVGLANAEAVAAVVVVCDSDDGAGKIKGSRNFVVVVVDEIAGRISRLCICQ